MHHKQKTKKGGGGEGGVAAFLPGYDTEQRVRWCVASIVWQTFYLIGTMIRKLHFTQTHHEY